MSDAGERDRVALSAALQQLFATHLSPRGRRYTLHEVGAATGLSASYLSMLCGGQITAPSGAHLQALATFFGVDVACFLTPQTAPQPAITTELRQALAQPLVADLALRAAQLPAAERSRVLQRLERGPADRRRRGYAARNTTGAR